MTVKVIDDLMSSLPDSKRLIEIGNGIGRSEDPARIGQSETLRRIKQFIRLGFQERIESGKRFEVELFIHFGTQGLKLFFLGRVIQFGLPLAQQEFGLFNRLSRLLICLNVFLDILCNGT